MQTSLAAHETAITLSHLHFFTLCSLYKVKRRRGAPGLDEVLGGGAALLVMGNVSFNVSNIVLH